MPFDGLVMHAVRSELTKNVIGGRIEKISQPSRNEVILHIHSKGSKFMLLMSANASDARVHLTRKTFRNPPSPPNFCILLRKYICGGRITGLRQPGLERILEISIDSANEIGDITSKTLVIEVMGKHSNIILLNESRKIIDSITHVDFSISSIREVMPGREYLPAPSQQKTDPLDTSRSEVLDFLSGSESSSELERRLVNSYTGISPFSVRRLIREIDQPQLNSGQLSGALADAFVNLIHKVKLDSFDPCIIFGWNNQPKDFHCFFGKSCNPEMVKQDQASKIEYEVIKPFESVSLAIDSFYSMKNDASLFLQEKSNLNSTVRHRLEKCIKKIGIQQDKIKNSAEREKLRTYGELLTANLYRLKDWPESISVLNYYGDPPEEIIIELNPKISPAQNAQNYFKKYIKAKNTFEAASRQLKELQDEQSYLESLLFQLEQAEDINDLSEIRDELVSEGIVVSSVKAKKSEQALPPRLFISSDGFTILVGRNNRQNDKLTLKTAARQDIWLHTKDIPGSHVIIRSDKEEVPDNTLLEAAGIAAWFSKARMSSKVPIDYTRVKNVKKPGGAKPGYVIYENFKTIYVTPESELIERLSAKKESELTGE